MNATTVTELNGFLDSHILASSDERIPTGIILTGPDSASQSSILDQLSKGRRSSCKTNFVSLTASQGTNLKALLKTIIQNATAQSEDVDNDDDDDDDNGNDHHTPNGKASYLLNYDLQILFNYVQDRDIKQVVLAVQDTEAFDSRLLSELVETLGFWSGRIPFIFLLNIATSLDFLQQRLSKQALKCMQCQLFDAAPSKDEVEQVFDAIIHPEASLCIGPGLMGFALERQNDFIQSINCLVEAVRYAYMSCYYANSLSIFLDSKLSFKDVPTDHFEAIRNLDSFRAFCKRLLENHEPNRLRGLLDNDEILFGMIRQKVQQGRAALAEINVVVSIVQALQLALPNQQAASKSTLYIQAMSDKLNDSSHLRSFSLSIRKASPNTALTAMNAFMGFSVRGDIHHRCSKLREELSELVNDQDETAQPLRSEDDVKNSTLRTTVIAQKVELSKQKSSLSKRDAAYTAILRRFTDLLEEYFAIVLVDPTSLVFHEIFLYDLKSPHREVFTPKPRHANERALATPYDYLACECCTPNQDENDESTLAASQPATATLYQLYLESGSLINVNDLWQAFQAVNGDEQNEEQNMALFHRALAELQYLGLMKSTRRRIDHVAKVAWRGL